MLIVIFLFIGIPVIAVFCSLTKKPKILRPEVPPKKSGVLGDKKEEKEYLIKIFEKHRQKILSTLTGSDIICCESKHWEVTVAMISCLDLLYESSLRSTEKVKEEENAPNFENPLGTLREMTDELITFCKGKKWIWQDNTEIAKRRDLYSNYCSSTSSKHVWLNWCVTSLQTRDWNMPYKVAGMLSDLITNPYCVDNYETAPVILNDYFDNLSFQNDVFVPLTKEISEFCGVICVEYFERLSVHANK